MTQHSILKQSLLKLIQDTSKSVVLLLVLAGFSACEKPSNQDEQGFQELSLDTELASITIIDSLCFVGGENGDLYILKNGKVCNYIQSDESRIYSVFYSDTDTCFFGMRNRGVVGCRMPNQNDGVRQGYVDIKNLGPHYKKIPNDNGNNKGYEYSPYGFIKYDETKVITTTSNGLFYFGKDSLGTVSNSNRAGDPFMYYSPVSTEKRIFIAAKDGAVWIDKNGGVPGSWPLRCLNGKQITKLEVGKDSPLYALANSDSLYVVDVNKDTIINSCKLPISVFGMVRAEGKLYFVNSSSLFVTTEEEVLKKEINPNIIVPIKLPHIVPSNTRNVIAYDSVFHKVRIVTSRSVLSFPAINAIGQSDVLLQSCIDVKTKNFYFLNTTNELFIYRSAKEAKKILQLPRNEEISELCVNDNVFFYVANHRVIKKVVNKGVLGFINNKLNHINHSICTHVCDLAHELTAMLVDGDTAYVGIKDSLLRIDLNTGRCFKSDDRPIKSYITRFQKRMDGIILAATLNDGLINLKENSSVNKRKFLNDFFVTDNGDTLLLDNHYVFLQNHEPKDSLKADGYSRLFHFGNNGVAISKRGVLFFTVVDDSIFRKRTYEYFINPEACNIDKDTLFLATDWGMLKMNIREDPQLEEAKGVKIAKTVTDWVRIIIIILIIALLGYIMILFLVKRIRELKHKKEELERQVKEIEEYKKKLEEEKRKLEDEKKGLEDKKEKLQGQVNGLREEKRKLFEERIKPLHRTLQYITVESLKEEINNLKKKINAGQIDDNMNKHLQNATAKIAQSLVEKIHLQINELQETEWYGALKYVETSEKAIDKKNKKNYIEELANVIDENKSFIEKVKCEKTKIKNYETLVSHFIVVKDVTDGLSDKLNDVKKNLLNEQGQTEIDSLTRCLNQLNTPEKIDKVNNYIEKEMPVTENLENRDFARSLSGQLTEIRSQLNVNNISIDDMHRILKSLRALKRQRDIMRTLEYIRNSNSKEHIDNLFAIIAEEEASVKLLKDVAKIKVTDTKSRRTVLIALIMSHPRGNKTLDRYKVDIYNKVYSYENTNRKPGKEEMERSECVNKYKKEMSFLCDFFKNLDNNLIVEYEKKQKEIYGGLCFLSDLLRDCQDRLKNP